MGDRRALIGLWTVPGIGLKTLQALGQRFGSIDALLGVPARKWKGVSELHDGIREFLPDDFEVGAAADQLLARYARLNIKLAFKGQPEYPARLAEVDDAPPLLFYAGPGAKVPPRRRLAMVGTRKPEAEFVPIAQKMADDVAALGVGIVSGGADGIDQICHLAAAAHGAETWAFLGSSLDQIDEAQRLLWNVIKPAGATLWSEYPPGVRAGPGTFPRRNRLISGSADAVLVLRAAIPSGCKYTVEAAIKQRRPVLAMPGEVKKETAAYCNALIRGKQATMCLDALQAVTATGATGLPSHQPESVHAPVGDLSTLSERARAALVATPRQPTDFEVLVDASRLGSGALLAALSELEVNGYVVQHPNRRYQRL